MNKEEVLHALSEHQRKLARLGIKPLALFGSAAQGEEFLERVLGCSVDPSTPGGNANS